MKKFLSLVVVTIFLFSGCQDQNNVEPTTDTGGSVLDKSYQTSGALHSELQTLKAVTAKYHDIENAIADGYMDIDVVIPHMGHHFLNPAYMDATFELTKPEILVYTLHDNGRYELVAIEYGVPLTLAAAPPEGFTGSGDVWAMNTDAGIWALHAWIWKYNPMGVFNGFNPNVP